jgi:ribosomal protein L37AE/L43A
MILGTAAYNIVSKNNINQNEEEKEKQTTCRKCKKTPVSYCGTRICDSCWEDIKKEGFK